MDFELLASGFDFLECPTSDLAGGLYFVDRERVYHLSRDGSITTILERPVGGIALHASGGVVVSGPDVAHLTPSGDLRVLWHVDGNVDFNDLCTDASGRIYCGVVRPCPSGERYRTLPGELWRISQQGAGEVIYDDVGFSNGLGFSPDNKTLFHADSFRREIIVYDAGVPPSLTYRTRFSTSLAPGYPDGLAIDEDGCIFVGMFEGGCVARFDPQGRYLGKIDYPARSVMSVCFAGDDRRALIAVTCDNSRDAELKGCIISTAASVAGLSQPLATV